MTKCYLMTTAASLLGGCAPAAPDYGPIGSGLTAIGICLVVYGVVRVLGELVRQEPPDSPPPQRDQPGNEERR